jgi:ClpP class serine protease
MAESATKAELVDEVQELRDQIKALEEDLKKKRKEKKDKDASEELTDSWESLSEQMNRLTRGLFYAAMEAMAVSANMTQKFVEKTEKHNTRERRDTWSKMVTDLPVDMSKAFAETLKAGAEDTEKIVDKFYSKYKE